MKAEGEVQVAPRPGRSADPGRTEIRPDEVRVWCATLDQPDSRIRRFSRTLTRADLAEAERYRFDRHRDRFVVRRAVLRHILASCLGEKPAALVLARTGRGKPFLAAPGAAQGLRFSVSHTGALALYAVAWDRRVGIDVERVRSDLDVEGIARRFFSAREVELLQSLPRPERPRAFFRVWTRKEAYLKGRGDGLTDHLDTFSVVPDPRRPYRPLPVEDPLADGRWSVQELRALPGFVAALAVEGRGWRLAWAAPRSWTDVQFGCGVEATPEPGPAGPPSRGGPVFPCQPVT